ncbi:bifunctional (p)ppGpp synthetase/guanosine-3',5'-bis(diphosphate) 3'-pyrophosphohydrolase [Candidatus Woesearchaeota archaeon]|nr:bifunctional (p)ppGpp synthetase/guanosine-3',5'-bis(diphosphate) 3'-pyrophosphohydrolase [Candidatus Woesearchaeota archaeon]
MDKERFLENCKNKEYDEGALKLIAQAAEFAQEKLKGKFRLNGTVLEHNLRVGSILVDNNSPPEVVVAGLLHGLSGHKEEMVKPFGAEIWDLVKEAEDVKELKSKNKSIQAEALKKILLTTLSDVRVILVKLANKLDNLRTIQYLPPEEQHRISQEVLDVYAPLAYRLGVEKIRVELEDLAFKVINPQKYAEINLYLHTSSEQREKDIGEAIESIQQLVKGKVSLIKIKGRSKHIYSIYKKMALRGVKLEDQYDLYGIRIIVSEERDCYTLLGLLHENFEPLPSRLKDYIAAPKSNFYRSIHTGVKLPNGKIIELQIRTPEMDAFAEEGIAAHWKYKKMGTQENFEKKVSWLREILNLHKDEGDKEFLEAAKVDVFGDNIFCYTPKGDAKELPKGATVLDFAYAVHEEVGNHAIGGRVNGKFVPLRKELGKGDVVEVITNKVQRPHRSWLKIVKSPSARQKIRKFLREVEKLPDLHYRRPKVLTSEEQSIMVDSVEYPTALCLMAKCCEPLPGEGIVGILTKRKLISVHKKECREVQKEEERWVDVKWKETFNQKIRFFVRVNEAKAKLIGSGEMEGSFLVVPKDLEQVKELVRRVGKVKGVRKVYFE